MCSETLHLGKEVKDVRFAKPGQAPSITTTAQDELHAALEEQTRAREQLARERAELLELKDGVLQAIAHAVPQMTHESEKALVALALEAVEKLVAGMPVSAELVEASIREALQQVRDKTAVAVLLHPEDLALLQRANSSVLALGADEAKVEFRTSAEVTRGGCLVHSAFGVIDARRETKQMLLRESLLES